MEIEIQVKRVDQGQKQILDCSELKIIPVSTGAIESVNVNVNVNEEDMDKKQEENFDSGIPSFFLFDEDRRYTKEDLTYNFLALKWASWLKMSPFSFGVDGNSKNCPRIRMAHKKWWGNGISLGWFLFATVRVLVMIWSTAHFWMTGDPEENLGQMTLMLAATIGAILLIYQLFSYNSSSQDVVPFLLSVFRYLDAESDSELQQKRTRPQKFGFGFGLGGRTLQELLIIHFPLPAYSMGLAVSLLSAVDPSFPLLLVSLVQPEISFSFLFLAALDSVVFLYYFMIAHLVFYIFMGMHRITEEAGLTLKNLMTKTKTKASPEKMPTPMPTVENEKEMEMEESIKLQRALKNLGLLNIWTWFFNKSFSNVVYGVKLVCMTSSISGGFGLIKMIGVENVPYAGIFAILLFNGIVAYNLGFGRAFEMPEKVEELKREIIKRSFKTYRNNPVERRYVDRYLRSIPWLGVNDGVYRMERMTCVNYTSFAVQQISSLVLTF